MIFRQVIQDDLGCASYLLGDEHCGRAAVVDPRFDIDVYLQLAELFGVEITDIVETHTHADHISGHGRLAEVAGARIHLPAGAGAEYPHAELGDGDELLLGSVVIRAVSMPGHRPEHTAFTVTDSARGPDPWALLSGDSLLVGDVARPDLAVAGQEGAALLHASLLRLFDLLADETELWPGHVGGSTCGSAAIDMKPSSTLGYERVHNPLLSLDEAAFVEAVNADLGTRPANYEGIVAINRGPLRSGAIEPAAVGAEEVEGLLRGGAVAVDVRGAPHFDAAHIPGSVSFPAGRPGFAAALARALGAGLELVMVGAGEGDARSAARYTESVGVSRPVAVLTGGFHTWESSGRPVEAIEAIDGAELDARARSGELQLVDVRDAATFAAGSLPGAVNVTHTDLSQIPAGIDPSAPVAVFCATGKRAGIGASLLRRAGAERVIHVTTGPRDVSSVRLETSR